MRHKETAAAGKGKCDPCKQPKDKFKKNRPPEEAVIASSGGRFLQVFFRQGRFGRPFWCGQEAVRSLSVLREGRRDGAQLPAGFEHKLYRGEGAAGLAAVIDGEDALGAVDHEAVAVAVNAGGIALGENMQL